jgi:hypothetical protein
MPTIIPPASIQNLQQVEAYVSGPDTANRLLTISGQFDAGMQGYGTANGYGQSTTTFSVLVGPVLTHNQFFKAIATGSLTKIAYQNQGAAPFLNNWNITAIDAEWDDQSGQVELTIEVSAQAYGLNNSTILGGLNFQVTILYMAAA